MKRKKKKRAPAIVDVRWGNANPADVTSLAQSWGRRRWKGTTAAERSKAMQALASLPRGKRKPHCPCGAMTLERARKRNHKCAA